MSALTVYFTNTADSVLTHAVTLVANQTGGANTGKDGVTVGNAPSGWGEFWFQGGQGASWPNAGAMGSPTGRGAIFDSTLLDACTISAGNWTPTIRHSLNTGNGAATGDIWVNFYDFDGVSVYALIGSSITTGATIPTTTATLTLTAANLSAYTFAAGHKFYIDAWLHLTANLNTVTTATWRINESNSTTLGSSTNQVVMPTYFLIAPTINVVSNSLLSENAQLVASIANVVSSSALSENAQIVGAATNAISTSALVESNARIVAPANVVSNSALSENAQLIASVTNVQSNSALSHNAQIVASAANIISASALVLSSAQIVAIATIIAQSALSATGSVIVSVAPNIPGTATASIAASGLVSASVAASGNVAATLAAMGSVSATDARG